MNLSLAQLSQILGEGKGKIAKWESSNTIPVIYIFPKIIEFLGYDPLFDNSETIQAKIENYRRKHGLSYLQLSRLIQIGQTTLLQVANYKGGSDKTVKLIQTYFRETSI